MVAGGWIGKYWNYVISTGSRAAAGCGHTWWQNSISPVHPHEAPRWETGFRIDKWLNEEWFRFPYKLIIKFNLKLTLLFNYSAVLLQQRTRWGWGWPTELSSIAPAGDELVAVLDQSCAVTSSKLDYVQIASSLGNYATMRGIVCDYLC